MNAAFDAIEAQRLALGERTAGLSEAQARWRPDPSVWSVASIAEHLALTDAGIGRLPPPGPSGLVPLPFRLLPREWRWGLVLRALDRDVALPLPSPGVEPSGEAPLAGSLETWGTNRAEMRRELEGLAPEDAPYFHPVLGPLSGMRMLALARTHAAYHARQAERLMSRPDFPRV